MTSLTMQPPTGERLLRFVGDWVNFSLRAADGASLPAGWRVLLRTNLGRAAAIRDEIVLSRCQKLPLAGASWHDIPMRLENGNYQVLLPLTEVGYFKSKAYAVDSKGRQHWPEGPDIGITVHPDSYRTANSIYCAFIRMFGPQKSGVNTQDERIEKQLKELDNRGYTVIPPSGKFRDLIRELPHIIDTLGCRILHLLPISPTPATFARFGRFGSPYAVQDLVGIDPALMEFDRRTTGIDQFRELAYAVHAKGARVFIDLVINHTGWGSTLQENHPEWFLRDGQGAFVSPGAWGTTWEDLVELAHRHVELWDYLADVFLTWCRRGVDGFRCDAGYKVPLPAWQYITARVRQEFPSAIFLLEGLGGAWEITASLLTDGGMQWAYSELFQNYSGAEVANYLEHSLRQSERVGLLLHYSETHDNPRLAEKGRAWSLLRNQLCAMTSVSGGFGFACGVEWLAAERINVHSARGLAWGNPDNLVPELAQLNRLLADHPAFFDAAKLTRLSPLDSPIYALRRDSAEGKDSVLVLINNDVEKPRTLALDMKVCGELSGLKLDLLGRSLPKVKRLADREILFHLEPGAAYCLAATAQPQGASGHDYRRARAQAAWALTASGQVLPTGQIPSCDWRGLAGLVDANPARFLARLQSEPTALLSGIPDTKSAARFPEVVTWRLLDQKRVTLVPLNHWLLIQDRDPFRASLSPTGGNRPQHAESISVREGHVACFAPGQPGGDATLSLERYGPDPTNVGGQIRFLSGTADLLPKTAESGLVLLTNGIGGMARLRVDLGNIQSKYDCLLGANLHAVLPVDRHIFAKRARVWVSADGFLAPLNKDNLIEFDAGPPAHWRFVANAGDGRSVEIELTVDMLDQCNTTVLRFNRPARAPSLGKDLPAECDVRLSVRVDIEDRNFHWETKRNSGAEHHFSRHSLPLKDHVGFAFTPAADRQLRVFADAGEYHHEAEWSENIPHPIEQSRGQTGAGDAYSPGWFDLPISKGANVTLVVTAEAEHTPTGDLFIFARHKANAFALRRANLPDNDAFGRQLVLAAQQFVVRRGSGKTVIAGYPWFLDWGRDTLIAARGLLAAGMADEVQQILLTFGRFVEHGTLPNTIHGENASNRDTSDAPLWYGIVCEELANTGQTSSPSVADGPLTSRPVLRAKPEPLYAVAVDERGRTIADVLREIALGYITGTPNGIRLDPTSGLIWSPAHFTWMDTNYPACTPREGYPIEIQVLWIRLLRQLERLDPGPGSVRWRDLAEQAQVSLQKFFWLEDRGYFADTLAAKPGQSAASSQVDSSLRSNYLFAVSLGLIMGDQAKRCVEAALRYLVIPGALRSLAPLVVSPPRPIYGQDGRLLNNPNEPYAAHYEGDEDTRRKLAYHNGTGWTWTFPAFCEALARAWDFSSPAVCAAKAYLLSMDRLLTEGCLGQIPEIIDGDVPHQQRGCDAQAWGVTEALRVWRLLNQYGAARS